MIIALEKPLTIPDFSLDYCFKFMEPLEVKKIKILIETHSNLKEKAVNKALEEYLKQISYRYKINLTKIKKVIQSIICGDPYYKNLREKIQKSEDNIKRTQELITVALLNIFDLSGNERILATIVLILLKLILLEGVNLYCEKWSLLK